MNAEVDTAGKIVVGTDGSERANKAVDWAADRAAARELPLAVLYVIPETPLPARTAAASAIHHGADYVADYVARSQVKVEKLVADLVQRHPGLSATGHAIQGNPSHVLANATHDADMVVVGARGHSAPLSVKLLGGVSDAVASHSKGSVVIVSDEAHENPKGPIVVGVDDSPEAKAAILRGFHAADTRGVPLIAINTWDFGPYDAVNAEVWDRSMTDITASQTEMVKKALADSWAIFPNVEVEIRVVRGRPETAIIEASKVAGLVVVGSRGRGGFTGLLLGSTSKHVLRESFCPVLVTRGYRLLHAQPDA